MAAQGVIRAGKHRAFTLNTHLVFVTKIRHPAPDPDGRDHAGGVCADFEFELAEFNHVHLLVNLPPKVAISKLVNSLKGVSSATASGQARTSPAGVGGAPLTVPRQYIEQQNRPV